MGGYFVYSFHMPLFCFISGYFFYGKHYLFKPFLVGKFKQLIIPCIIWGVLLVLYDYFIRGIDYVTLVKGFILYDFGI